MAAGDIILTDGTTITPNDLQKIAAAVEDLIAATAKDPGQYEEVTTLTGVTSLPVFLQLGAVYKLVRVAVSILKGVDGREVHLQVNQDKTYIQWRYTDGNWQNLIAVADLKGAPGDTPVFRTGSTGIEWKYQSEADTAYRMLVSIDVLKLKFSDLTPEQKDELALHFEDLTEEEKAELMKPATDAAAIANKAAEDADAATALAVQATANAKSVSDHPGYIGSDYHVYTWDYTTGSYNKTDTVLRPEGFSIYRSYSSIDAMNADLANVPEGKFVLINTNDVEQADNAKLYVRGATSFEYLVDMSGAIGFTGKTPQITIGTVTVGATASATLSPDGTDDDGNPRYKLNLVIVAGPQGFTPVIETGETTTGQPGTDASAELVPSGQTEDGRDKYILNLTIPRGNPGEGSGNVFVEPSGLESGKKYLFMPSTNGSTEGAFVEYVEPDIPEQVQPDWNATEGKGAILNKPDIPTKTSELENDSDFTTSSAVKDLLLGYVKKVAGKGLSTEDFTTELKNKLNELVNYDDTAIQSAVTSIQNQINTLLSGNASSAIESFNEIIAFLENVEDTETLEGIISGISTTIANVQSSIPTKLSQLSNDNNTVTDANYVHTDNNYSNEEKTKLSDSLRFKDLTVSTTLTGLSIANYSIKVTLSSASALSFASTPYEGWECMIDIKNTRSSAITQALPNASGWQCDETSITIGAGKIASISVRYVHGTYVVLTKGN